MSREIRKLKRDIKNSEMMISWSKTKLRKANLDVWVAEEMIEANTDARDKAQARLEVLIKRQEEDSSARV